MLLFDNINNRINLKAGRSLDQKLNSLRTSGKVKYFETVQGRLKFFFMSLRRVYVIPHLCQLTHQKLGKFFSCENLTLFELGFLPT